MQFYILMCYILKTNIYGYSEKHYLLRVQDIGFPATNNLSENYVLTLQIITFPS